ncbi:FecR family protein [Novosphingobium guangzhouense]|uniref:FecR protein domain-containing protein n=1 Tax=Novosphingobium guangzhouense TaxID=1850347 RepID=A0A2K2FX67_9SPHN|nr:FecR domain-containing protein [Novosphingobium guangzhouense]PNU03362.1 hypothetical protein A8V01_06440 [Novosphingobium guangzhouense]
MDERAAPILETAADWADRLDELTALERQELKTWLDASPDHARAFARMTRLVADTALAEALSSDTGAPALPSNRPDTRRRPGAWRQNAPAATRRRAIAAGLAGALALPAAGYWIMGGESRHGMPGPTLLASAVGQRRRLELPDGSGLLLDASSRVAVDFAQGRRAVVLEQGAARFDVRHDPERPFEVHTPQARMTALGTSFSVDYGADGSELRVFSGKVGIDGASGSRLVVPARQWAMIGADRISSRGTFDPDAGDWQTDWLDAQAMPLGRAVARLSRYSTVPLRLGQERFAALTFSGRFRLDAPEESLALIGALFGLETQRRDGAVYLDRPVAA